MEIINYYTEYRTLKAHFNDKNFTYKINTLPVQILWNREYKKAESYFIKFQQKYTIGVFKALLISSFVNNSKTYFMNLESSSNLENFKRFKIWWSNPLYYFKKDLQNIVEEKDEPVYIETYVILDNYFQITSDWYQKQKNVYDKYFYLIKTFTNTNSHIHKIIDDEDIKNLIQKILKGEN